MSLTDLEPFDGLSVITSEIDEIEVAHLLHQGTKLGIICQDCGGRKFKVEGFIPVELELIANQHIAVTHIDYKKVIVNRVVRCVHCDCTDFVTITEATEEENGQEFSSVG